MVVAFNEEIVVRIVWRAVRVPVAWIGKSRDRRPYSLRPHDYVAVASSERSVACPALYIKLYDIIYS